MHYGPAWPRDWAHHPVGDSLALCRPGPVSVTMTTHRPWVTCLKCRELLDQPNPPEGIR